MEIKYEAVFGPQELFDGSPVHCEFAVKTKRFGIEWYKSSKDAVITAFQLASTEVIDVAMRRIIRTPTWTVADQKAGKLPEVGAKFKARGYVWECVRILNNTVLAVVGDSYCGFDINECKPIESPEEKAARLRSEWINKAYVDFHRLGCELEVLQKEQIKVIYDALLSGDLPVPGKGE